MEKKQNFRVCSHKFPTRQLAKAFAEKNNSEVKRCPAEGTNRDGYFKYVVYTCGKSLY